MAGELTALVPMKGHSERVKNKNLRLFAGDPLFFHVMRTLERAKRVDRICVNTDSEVIADQLRQHFPDVIIHWRPEEIRGDFVSMNRIIGHDLAQIEGDHFLQTHATNPLLLPETVDRAAESWLAQEKRFDSLFSVTAHRSRFYTEDGKPVNHDPIELLRTQDLPPLLEENSCIYLFSRRSFARTDTRIGQSPQLFAITPLEAVDIDTEQDFLLAETLLLRQRREDGAGSNE